MQREKYFRTKLVFCLALAAMFGFMQVGCDRSEQAKPDPAGDSNDTPMIPMELELPKYILIGTPADVMKVPNLAPPRENKSRILMPEGTVNLALGMNVTSSDSFPIIGELGFVTDGAKKSIDGFFVELGPMLQWVQIDLEKQCAIYAILAWHYHAQIRVYYSVVVQVADDADFTQNVRTLFNNDQNGSAGLGIGNDLLYADTHEGKLIDA